MMIRCKNCLMPDTKPGLILNENGVCQACTRFEMRKSVDYNKRFSELRELAQKHKRTDGYYDCIIAVSGGKDSHFQVYVCKELLGMNPLLVSAGDPFSKTSAGVHNIKNIGDAFNCDMISLQLSPDLARRMGRIAFKDFGSPNWPIDQAIYVCPIRMAINLNIPLVIYGENVSYEYGGVQDEETYSAKDQINNDVVKNTNDWQFWLDRGIKDDELNMLKYPEVEEMVVSKLEPVFLSYFLPWDGYKNYLIAKKYGFRDLSHEWQREGYIETYDQVDSIAYLVHIWLKYPKFGFARATDVVGYWLRSGRITKEKGIKLIKENDSKLDQKALSDFLTFFGYTPKEFWDIVEGFWNREIFEKINEEWRLKHDGF